MMGLLLLQRVRKTAGESAIKEIMRQSTIHFVEFQINYLLIGLNWDINR